MLLVTHGEALADADGVRIGDRVRIKTPDLTSRIAPTMLRQEKISMFASETFLVGRVVGQDGEIMELSVPGADSTLRVSMHDVTQLDVWSQGDRRGEGILVGLLGGAVVGGIIGHSLEDDPPPSNGSGLDCSSYFCSGVHSGKTNIGVPSTVTGVLLGALIGAVTGRLIGSTMPRDRWESVDVPRFKARVVAVPEGGAGLGCSVSF